MDFPLYLEEIGRLTDDRHANSQMSYTMSSLVTNLSLAMNLNIIATMTKTPSNSCYDITMVLFKTITVIIFFFLIAGSGAYSKDLVWLIDIKGAIGPASADHVMRGLEEVQKTDASLVILQIDTPGGLDKAMRQIIKSILASKVPVVGFVSPSGARAASAGTYILYACHIAVMAPATNIGAATPVQIGTPTLPELPGKDNKEKESEQKDTPQPKTAMERKIINDAVAYIEGLAQLRGRNQEWGVRAVREGISLSANQALELNVINFVASDIDDLLQQLKGQSIQVNDAVFTPELENVEIYTYPLDWRSNFLSVITDPNVAYILMLIGIYGLIFEFSNPGIGVPGVLGAVCIFLALYAFQVLPISYAGLGLMLLGAGLMTAEAFAPSFGILGIGGVIAFAFGSIILMDTNLPGYKIAIPIIIAFTSFSAGLLIIALGLVLKARKQAVVTGLSHLQGAVATVNTMHNGNAMVRLEGELWQVECEQSLELDDEVTIVTADSLILKVKKLTGE